MLACPPPHQDSKTFYSEDSFGWGREDCCGLGGNGDFQYYLACFRRGVNSLTRLKALLMVAVDGLDGAEILAKEAEQRVQRRFMTISFL